MKRKTVNKEGNGEKDQWRRGERMEMRKEILRRENGGERSRDKED